MRSLLIISAFVVSFALSADAQNLAERLRNQASIAKTKENLARDREEYAQFEKDLAVFYDAVAASEVTDARLGYAKLLTAMEREVGQLAAKAKAAASEQRSSRREVGTERRELSNNRENDDDLYHNIGDRRDKRDDRRDYADDIKDTKTAEGMHAKAKSILDALRDFKFKLTDESGEAEAAKVVQIEAFKAIMKKDMELSVGEIKEDTKESAEDRRETREDRRYRFR